jgi:hypothetical protein
MILLKNVENNMKKGFKKYDSSYKRTVSPFTQSRLKREDLATGRYIDEPERYKDRAKQDLKDLKYGVGQSIPRGGDLDTTDKIALGAVGGGILYHGAKGTIARGKAISKAKSVGKAAKLIKGAGVVKTAAALAPYVGGYLLAREISRGVKRRRERRAQPISPYAKADPRRTIGRGKNFNPVSKNKSATGGAAGGGMTKKGVREYKRNNPGSKLQTAVTTKPSKLKPGSKAAKRRKSFCARSRSWTSERGKAARRRWNC